MEPINHDAGLGQDFANSIAVGLPHINRDYLHSFLIFQLPQPFENGVLVPVSKQVYNVLVFDVSENTARCSKQMNLINSKHGWGLNGPRLFQALHASIKDMTDSILSHPDLVAQAEESS